MGGMLRRAKTILSHTDFTAIYDKGCHTGSEFGYAARLGVHVLVAIPEEASHEPNPDFDRGRFYIPQRFRFLHLSCQTNPDNQRQLVQQKQREIGYRNEALQN
jgi:hypothetical protein